jgi:hypothetical protein
MAHGNYVFQSDWAKKNIAIGKAEGKAEGKVEAVLAFLDARGLAISAEQRAQVLACADVAILDRWIRKAATVTSADELFVE